MSREHSLPRPDGAGTIPLHGIMASPPRLFVAALLVSCVVHHAAARSVLVGPSEGATKDVTVSGVTTCSATPQNECCGELFDWKKIDANTIRIQRTDQEAGWKQSLRWECGWVIPVAHALAACPGQCDSCCWAECSVVAIRSGSQSLANAANAHTHTPPPPPPRTHTHTHARTTHPHTLAPSFPNNGVCARSDAEDPELHQPVKVNFYGMGANCREHHFIGDIRKRKPSKVVK